MKKLVLETTAPFQGLPELVAYDEGLFEKEGLESSGRTAMRASTRRSTSPSPPQQVNQFASHGKLFEQGKADMYNACEWGNYCRVGATAKGSRQLGRRAIIAYAAMVVRAAFAGLHAATARQQEIGVPFYFGTHYIALHMLQGLSAASRSSSARAPNGSRWRLAGADERRGRCRRR